MGAYFTIAALSLCLFVDRKHKLTARLLACEFFAMWAIHYFGYTVSGVLRGSELYLTYIIAQMPILFMMWLTHCSVYVRWLIGFSLAYNVLTISQFNFYTVDFYGSYHLVMRLVMSLQLSFLFWATQYVSTYRRTKRPNNPNDSYRLFNIRGWLGRRS